MGERWLIVCRARSRFGVRQALAALLCDDLASHLMDLLVVDMKRAEGAICCMSRQVAFWSAASSCRFVLR